MGPKLFTPKESIENWYWILAPQAFSSLGRWFPLWNGLPHELLWHKLCEWCLPWGEQSPTYHTVLSTILVLSDCASLTSSSITQIISFILLLTRLFPHVHGHLQTGTALTLSGSPSLAHHAVWWGGAHQEQMEALQAWGRLTWAPRQSPPASLSCSQSPTFNIEVTVSPGRRKWRCKALKSSLPTGHSKQGNSSHGFS